jgi:hypothetical protein
VATFRPDPGDAFARLVGATLVTEAVLLGISRLLTLVYLVAGQVYRPDEEHLAKTSYVPFLAIAVALVAVLGWAGAQLRRTPEGAWRAGGVAARIDLVLAGVLNAIVLVRAVMALLSAGHHPVEAYVAWAVAVVATLMVLTGLIRDAAGLARPRAAR